MMKQLNDDLISGEERARDMASRALRHLGFDGQP